VHPFTATGDLTATVTSAAVNQSIERERQKINWVFFGSG
jgi:hypothetical protein